MNVDNIRRLAARLREPDAAAHFDLSDWISVQDDGIDMTLGQAINNCGTVACIAGWACVLANPELSVSDADEPAGFNIMDTARDFLGLDPFEAHSLFVPTGHVYAATAAQAADVLDHLAETGEVVW